MEFNLIQGLRQVFRAVHIFASSLATQGTYLTKASAAGDVTLFVENTSNFLAAGGSGQIIDPANDRNTFTYSGITVNTLTGCSGVLDHANGMLVVPLTQTVIIDSDVNEIRVLGDVGGGVIEEIVDLGATGVTGASGSFGTTDSLNTGVKARSSAAPAVDALSVLSYGGKFAGAQGQLALTPNGAVLPTNPNPGDVNVDSLTDVYVGKVAGAQATVLVASDAQTQESPDNGTTWQVGNGLQNRAWSKPVWNGTVFTIVASGTAISATSTDGFNWTEHAAALPSSAAWGALVWNGAVYSTIELGVTSTKGATSPDGIVWTARTIPSATWAAQAVLGTTLGIVGNNKSAKSTNNGAAWTSASPSITFSVVGGIGTLFIAGVGTKIYSSPDCLTWTKRLTASDNIISISTFNGVAVASTTGILLYGLYRTIDGLNWAGIKSNIAGQNIDQNGQQFIAITSGSASALSSLDGITWNTLTLPASSAWVGLTGYFTSGGWQKLQKGIVYDSGALGSAVQDITVTGLDALTHGNYTVEIFIERGANGVVSWGVNGDTTAGDYVGDSLDGTGGVASSGGTVQNAIGTFGGAGDFIYGFGDLAITPSGMVMFTLRSQMLLSSTRHIREIAARKSATVANITEFDIHGSIANTIGVNSRVRIWRKN